MDPASRTGKKSGISAGTAEVQDFDRTTSAVGNRALLDHRGEAAQGGGGPAGRSAAAGGRRPPKYCNAAGVPVPGRFNQDALRRLEKGEAVFLCEGAPDVMTLEQEGFAAVGVVGSGGFKDEWIGALLPFKVHLALDSDEGGRRGAKRIRRMFHERDRPVWEVVLPEGVNDVNDFFLSAGASDFARLVGEARCRSPDLRKSLPTLLRQVADRSDSYSYPDLAERIYGWFEDNGGVFLVGGGQRCYLMIERVMSEIDNDPFNALMYSKTHLTVVQYQGRMVWQILRSLCFLRGRREETLSWVHSDESGGGALYVNLHDAKNRIACLRDGGVEVMSNGDNPAGVILQAADKMRPLELRRTPARARQSTCCGPW